MWDAVKGGERVGVLLDDCDGLLEELGVGLPVTVRLTERVSCGVGENVDVNVSLTLGLMVKTGDIDGLRDALVVGVCTRVDDNVAEQVTHGVLVCVTVGEQEAVPLEALWENDWDVVAKALCVNVLDNDKVSVRDLSCDLVGVFEADAVLL